MMINKSFNNKIVEKFENKTEPTLPQNKAKLEEITKKLYIEIFPSKPPPNKELIDFYVNYAMERKITESELKSLLMRQVYTSSMVKEEKQIYGTEDEVTELYNQILFRNPDEAELYNFAKLLKEDKNFNIEKLKIILYSSAEFKRLEKTQSNKVYGDVMNNITERQLEHMIINIYKEETNTSEELDRDTMRFLKKKFVSFDIDEVKFRKFIKNYMNNEPYEPPLAVQVKAETKVKPEAETKVKPKTEVKTESKSVTQEDLKKFKMEISNEIKKLAAANEPPNKPVIEILLKTAKENEKTSYIDSQNVFKEIKKEAKCVFDQEAIKQVKTQTLAEIQQERNKQAMQSTCVRNMKTLGFDEDMVLDPSLKWSVPQKHPPVCTGSKNDYKPDVTQTSLIGTLLPDAQNTKVGSILPMNPPR